MSLGRSSQRRKSFAKRRQPPDLAHREPVQVDGIPIVDRPILIHHNLLAANPTTPLVIVPTSSSNQMLGGSQPCDVLTLNGSRSRNNGAPLA
jgi:hypothetical protein